jgi:membrane associated rhomboid family serine protease
VVDYVGVVSQPSRKVRSVPKFTAFLLTGGVAGLLIGCLLSLAGPVDTSYDPSAVLGFLGLIFAGLGVLVGGIVAVLLDWRR